MRKPALAILASSMALLAGFVAPTAAQAATAPTTVTINFVDRPGPDIFRGRVGSPVPACREDRLVRLFKVVEGPDVFIDSDRSEDFGSWAIDIEGDPAPGSYYVRVPARTVGATTCAAARSTTIAVAAAAPRPALIMAGRSSSSATCRREE